jgi:nucleotidyltransferase substrate binding protein (TIGR01987 family)
MEKVNYKFEQLEKASARLDEALLLEFPTPETKADSVIRRFEFTTELFWKFLKALLDFQGHEVVASPREVIRTAKSAGVIQSDDVWIELIEDRNMTSHTYDDKKAVEIYDRIRDKYAKMFREFIENYARTL